MTIKLVVQICRASGVSSVECDNTGAGRVVALCIYFENDSYTGQPSCEATQ